MKRLTTCFFNVWEFFQNYTGEREVKKNTLHPSHVFKGCRIYYIKHDDSHCCGKHIFINKDTDDTIIFRHEYGHRIQSKILGIMFYPVVFIPSFLHFMYWFKFKNDNWDGYYDFYCERWANKLAKKKSKCQQKTAWC